MKNHGISGEIDKFIRSHPISVSFREFETQLDLKGLKFSHITANLWLDD